MFGEINEIHVINMSSVRVSDSSDIKLYLIPATENFPYKMIRDRVVSYAKI